MSSLRPSITSTVRYANANLKTATSLRCYASQATYTGSTESGAPPKSYAAREKELHQHLEDKDFPTGSGVKSQDGQKITYGLKEDQKLREFEQRQAGASADSGQVPTDWQKKMLVWTRLYNNQNQVPERVATGTLNKMHNRVRGFVVFSAAMLFLTILYSKEGYIRRKVYRDRAAGVTVDKMQ